MVKERITTIEDLLKILELMIDEKGGVGGYIDDTFEIKKSEKAFLIKSKDNTTTIEIPHSNCFSIEENVKRFEHALSCIGITKAEVDKPKEKEMKLSELIENLICLEGLEKEKKRGNGAPTSKAFKDYTVYIALKNYELYNKDGSIGIYRFNEPNPKASVLRDRYGLVDFGFIDDLEAPKETTTHDAVNHPKHYTQGKIECIEAMKAMLTPEEFRGFLRGSIFKYQWRVMDKNRVEDLEKAQWYLNYLIKELRELDKE